MFFAFFVVNSSDSVSTFYCFYVSTVQPQHPIYVAGFGQNRKATTVHDDLWAIACVIDDGWSRLGIVSPDAIGFFHDDVVRVRQRLAREPKLDYTIICSTHNHSTPDLMGLWGPDYLHTGVNRDYLETVRSAWRSRAGVGSGSVLSIIPFAFTGVTGL